MNYLREINAFYDWLETNSISDSAIVLWHALMHINNKAGWITEFAVAVSTLETKTGLKKDALFRARHRLDQVERIQFKSRTGQQSAIYRIIPFENDCVALTDTNSDTKCDTNRVSNRTQTATQSATINKLKETKQKEINPSKFPDDSPEMVLALKLRTHILKNNDKARVPKDLQGWASEFDKMLRIDGRNIDQVKAVMKFSQQSTFWASNILSAKKLREKYDTLYLQSKNNPGHPGDLSKAHPPDELENKRKDVLKKLYA